MNKLSAETKKYVLKLFRTNARRALTSTEYLKIDNELEALEVEPELSAFKSGDLIAVRRGRVFNELEVFKGKEKHPLHIKLAKLFTPHDGGEMPECLRDKRCNVLFRDGSITTTARSDLWRWAWEGKANDIIGYEIIGEK